MYLGRAVFLQGPKFCSYHEIPHEQSITAAAINVKCSEFLPIWVSGERVEFRGVMPWRKEKWKEDFIELLTLNFVWKALVWEARGSAWAVILTFDVSIQDDICFYSYLCGDGDDKPLWPCCSDKGGRKNVFIKKCLGIGRKWGATLAVQGIDWIIEGASFKEMWRRQGLKHKSVVIY